MKSPNKFLAKAMRFCADTKAAGGIIIGAAMPIVIVVGGVGLDLTTAQIQQNSAIVALNSAGNFASQISQCVSQNGGAADATCLSNLNNVVNSYVAAVPGVNNLNLGVSTGVWCTTSSGSSSFVKYGNSLSSCTSSTAAIQVNGTYSYQTKFLRIFGANNLSKKITMTIVNDLVTSIATANICPSIILNERLLTDSAAGDILWKEGGQYPRQLTKFTVRAGQGTQSWAGENGSTSFTSFWNYDPKGSRASFPTSEISSGTTPISSIGKESGTDFDLTVGRTVTVWPTTYSSNSGSAGKTVLDPETKTLVTTSDNGGEQIFKEFKKYEGQTCMALVGQDMGNKKVKIKKIIPVTWETICTGKRKRLTSSWQALEEDGVTVKAGCSYTSDVDKVDPHFIGRIGESRTDDSKPYILSQKEKWGGRTNGQGSSDVSAKAFFGTPRKAEERSNFN